MAATTPDATLLRLLTLEHFDKPPLQRFSAAACGAVFVEGAGELVRLNVANKNGSTVWIQIFDKTGTIPAEGAAPIHSFPVATNSSASLELELPFENGLWIVGSSTAFTKTIIGTDDLLLSGKVRATTPEA